MDLNSWGNVKFVSGIYLTEDHIPLAFCLTNKDGDISYDFDSIPNSEHFAYIEVKAVSFVDVNKGGLKDIIIIVDHKDAVGNDIATKRTAAVYLQKADGSFTIDEKLNQEINDSENNKEVKTVKKYLSQKF